MTSGTPLFQNAVIIQKPDLYSDPEMKIWTEKDVEELKNLIKMEVPDKEIAHKLSIKFNKKFTPNSVKKKRGRLNLFKKPKKIINATTFNIQIKKRKNKNGYLPAFFPLELAKKAELTNKDHVLCKLNDKIFVSAIRKIERNDRPNDYFSFYIPFKLLKANLAKEKVKFIKKIVNANTVNSWPLIEMQGLDFIDLYSLTLKSTDRIKPFLYSNKLFAGSGRAGFPTELPRYIELDERLIQSLGFFQGEGSKTHFRRVEIVNSNSDLINLFLDYFEKNFQLPRDKWRARVIYTNPTKMPHKEELLKNLWSKQTEIPLGNFTKTKLFIGNPKAENGSLHLYLPGLVFREIWFSILNNINLFLTKKTDYSKWFLQGVLAADGSPIISNGKLNEVMIRVENQKEIDLYSNAFKNLGIDIKSNLKYRSIRIFNQRNLLKVFTHELFKLHNERHIKFLNGLHNRKRLQSILSNLKGVAAL